MKKQIIFEADKDSIIFKDSEKEDAFYCMTQEVLREKMKIAEQFGRREINVPDEFTIKVSPIRKVESKDYFTDIYRPSTEEFIDFPINKIEWIWIRLP
jgi:hypothetical protein